MGERNAISGGGAPGAGGRDAGPAVGLAAVLDEAWAAGARAWPGMTVDRVTFDDLLGARLPRAGDLTGALAALHAADLYLACGCVAHDPAALAAFDEHVLVHVDRALARMRLGRAAVDEIKQVLRVRLLLPRGDRPPRIADYSGRGPLVHWVKIAALRQALNARRAAAPRRGDEPARDARPDGSDPEASYIKTRYASEVSLALRRAMAALSAREREVLRLHYVEGLTEEAMGAGFGVHRTTVARWLRAAREALVLNLRRHLAARLRLGRRELDSLIGAVRSRIDLRLSSALGKPR